MIPPVSIVAYGLRIYSQFYFLRINRARGNFRLIYAVCNNVSGTGVECKCELSVLYYTRARRLRLELWRGPIRSGGS